MVAFFFQEKCWSCSGWSLPRTTQTRTHGASGGIRSVLLLIRPPGPAGAHQLPRRPAEGLEVLVDEELAMTQRCTLVARKANGTLRCSRRSEHGSARQEGRESWGRAGGELGELGLEKGRRSGTSSACRNHRWEAGRRGNRAVPGGAC